MEDNAIIALYFARSEAAVSETMLKYGKLCRYIAQNILANTEDSEECVNDTMLCLWQTIPPQQPSKLSAFVGRVARNLALKKYHYLAAAKRNPAAVASLSELADCVSGRESVEDELENKRIEAAISNFLWQQDIAKRTVFIRRYWFFEPIADICRHCGFSRSKVTSMLYQTRQKLKTHIESEGIWL